MKSFPVIAMLVSVICVPLAQADLVIPSDGSDGPFNPTTSDPTEPVVIDLSQAVTGAWDANNSANASKGIYDPSKWAVVFKYSSINIPAGVTITFKNHPTHAPVVWLVQGGAVIGGTVDLSGKWNFGSLNEPGPGGFRGSGGGAGFGIGGGSVNYDGQFKGVYGSARLLPLIGGSGGGWNTFYDQNGGGGGGALLLAVGQNLNINGEIKANGGGNVYYGSGGAIRIIAENVAGAGQLSASGDSNNNGRIRIESSNGAPSLTSIMPTASITQPGSPPVIWLPEDAPSVRILSIHGVSAPDDPQAAFGGTLGAGAPDITLVDVDPMTVRAETRNFPTNGTVSVRWTHAQGPSSAWVSLTLESGDATQAVWKADVTRDPAQVGPYTVWQAKAKAAVPPN